MRRSNVESDHSEFDYRAGARHMLIRMGLLRASRVLPLSALLLVAGQMIYAQSAEKASSQSQPAIRRTALEPTVQFADVVRVVEHEGRSTTIGSYIAEGVGIKTTQLDSSPVQAHVVSDTQRELCVIDDTGDLLFMALNGETTVVYLANHAGVLQLAGYFQPGRFHSQNFKGVSKEKAAAAFVAEKEYWMRKTFPSKSGESGKVDAPVTIPGTVRSEPAKKSAKIDRKTNSEVSAPTTGATAKVPADLDEKEKLSQMSPKDRIKYLDEQIREAKQQEKLEKKEKEKAKKNADKDSQAAPADTNGDTAPQKKKISWF